MQRTDIEPNIVGMIESSISSDYIVSHLLDIIAFPEVSLKINNMVEEDRYSTRQFASVIEQDSILTAKLLHIANSPFYGNPNNINTISQAIMVVGIEALRDLAWATSSIHSFSRLATHLIDMDTFWRHSLFCGILARVLAEHCEKPLQKESLFVSGLLHDVGHLAMHHMIPEKMKMVLDLMDKEDLFSYHTENSVLGYNYCEIGAKLFDDWGLPKSLVNCVRYHHEPWIAPENELEASIIYIANNIAKSSNVYGYSTKKMIEHDMFVWEITGFIPDMMTDIQKTARDQYRAATSLFLSACHASDKLVNTA